MEKGFLMSEYTLLVKPRFQGVFRSPLFFLNLNLEAARPMLLLAPDPGVQIQDLHNVETGR